MQASHQLLESTLELGFRIRAPSFAELLAEAGRTLSEVMRGEGPVSRDPHWRDLEVHSVNREALLVDWLNELIFIAETEKWIPDEIQIASVSHSTLRARARGLLVDDAQAQIKAATFHGLTIKDLADGLEVEIVLDV